MNNFWLNKKYEWFKQAIILGVYHPFPVWFLPWAVLPNEFKHYIHVFSKDMEFKFKSTDLDLVKRTYDYLLDASKFFGGQYQKIACSQDWVIINNVGQHQYKVEIIVRMP